MNTTVPDASPASAIAPSAPPPSTATGGPAAPPHGAPQVPVRWLLIAVAVALCASVLVRLSAYGIWDPWELSVADAARKLGEGSATSDHTSLALRLVQASFA